MDRLTQLRVATLDPVAFEVFVQSLCSCECFLGLAALAAKLAASSSLSLLIALSALCTLSALCLLLVSALVGTLLPEILSGEFPGCALLALLNELRFVAPLYLQALALPFVASLLAPGKRNKLGEQVGVPKQTALQ